MAHGYSSAIALATVLVIPAEMPTFRIMAGKCAWSCGLVFCSCTGFDAPFQELLAEKLPSTECPYCHHPLSNHEEVKSPLATSHDVGSESVQELTNHKEKGHEFRFVSHRTDTVRILAELVDRENVVHVRGTPASGKTTLARLLQQYYNNQKRTIYFISNWKKLEDYPTEGEDKPWEKLSQVIHSRYKFTGRTRNLPSGTIIIIDEAQKTYSDTEFWNLVIKERIYGKGDDIKFCLFCSYGNPLTGVDGQTDMFTPAIFKPSQRVTLTPQSLSPSIEPFSPPSIGLFFTTDEFKDAVKQICADTKFEVGFMLGNDAEDYLFSLTNGHPGGVKSLLNYFYHHYRDRIKHGKLSPITKVNLVDSLQDDGKVWRYLETTPVYRSFPTGPLLSVQVAKVLRHVLEQGSIPVGKQEDITVAVDGDTDLEEAKDRCYTNGWLHKTLVLEDKVGKEEYVLPSRLHEKWVEWILRKQNICLNSKYNSLQ